MQNVINSTRERLAPFIPEGPNLHDYQSQTPETSHRFIRLNPEIPQENYDKLPKLVPISWL
jgi:hypothetical protein